jgi:hypothetical protein
VRKVCNEPPEHLDGDVYLISPLNAHERFEEYAVRIDPEYGVYWLKAFSGKIDTDDHGHELLSAFGRVVESIEKTYGESEKVDRKSEVWGDKPEYFMYALQKGDRMVGAYWKDGLPNDISLIAIWIEAGNISSDIGYIFLQYDFSNAQSVEAKADSVF